jgi:hypothetical protein
VIFGADGSHLSFQLIIMPLSDALIHLMLDEEEDDDVIVDMLLFFESQRIWYTYSFNLNAFDPIGHLPIMFASKVKKT